MRDICDGVSSKFGPKLSARGRKSEKAESFGFMRGEQKILPDLSGAKTAQFVLCIKQENVSKFCSEL